MPAIHDFQNIIARVIVSAVIIGTAAFIMLDGLMAATN